MNLSLTSKIIICIIVVMSLGFLSGYSTADSINGWYAGMNKPFFNPPNWIFGPVWTVLYAMIGAAVAIIWHANVESSLKTQAILLFISQLVLNLIWSPVFFTAQKPGAALIIILSLLLMIFVVIKLFRKINKQASNLMIPYLIWVSFASLLNASIVYLN